jgi:tetratricopeptide (TPR) repeat protein
MCFVAMPFGQKAPPGKRKPIIDFDRLYDRLKSIIEDAALEPVRADFEPSGGFVHRPMYERLLVAEYVVADLTFGNPNVAYELGVRHGASRGATLLLCAEGHVPQLPFDLKPLRVIPYTLDEQGRITPASARALRRTLTERIQQLRRGELPSDNPLLQVTQLGPGRSASHEKTDVFLQRMHYVSDTAQRIASAIALSDKDQARARLDALRDEVLQARDVPQLHTVLLALFLGYREHKAYTSMVELYSSLPAELQRTAVVREQLALAFNRLAESAAKNKDEATAEDFRKQALRVLEQIPPEERTSETQGIAGRIYKGLYDAHAAAGRPRDAEAALTRAIAAYEDGFRMDPCDYYPGVNAVTLRLVRGRREDAAHLERLIPVVRFSVERAPPPTQDRPLERYWQEATKLELACAGRDWRAARQHLDALIGLRPEPWLKSWMYETTADNLHKQLEARRKEPQTKRQLSGLVRQLRAQEE